MDNQNLSWEIRVKNYLGFGEANITKYRSEEKNLSTGEFCCSSEPWYENEKTKRIDRYLDLARELKKLCNTKGKVNPIVVSVFGTVPRDLEKKLGEPEISNRTDSIQTTAQLKAARILRRVLETWRDLLSLGLQWKTTS